MSKKKNKLALSKPNDPDFESLNPFAPFQEVADKWTKDTCERKRYIGTVLKGCYTQFYLLQLDSQEELLKAYSIHFLKHNKSMIKSVLPMLKGLFGGD